MSGSGALPEDWPAQLRERADQPPLRERRLLAWQGATIGSIEPELVDLLHERVPSTRAVLARLSAGGFEVRGEDLTSALDLLALALRETGQAHVWRDEQLGVRDDQGRLLGTVERAVVRPLGIATHAVHLVGCSPDGRHWVQQRAFAKANDPGLWDTLVGGMVPAADDLQQALARETWEEAGLHLEHLEQLAWGGQVLMRRPTADTRRGYIVEAIDWYRCVVPAGREPVNQDGEVEQFRLLPADALRERLLRNEFTLEAALVYAAAWG